MKINKNKVQISNSLVSMILIIGSAIIFISCNGCKSTSLTKEKSLVIDKRNRDNASANSVDNSSPEFNLGILKGAPMLPLVDADIKQVFDHYILQDSNNSFKYHLYDGNKQQTIEISPDEKFEISGNQKFMLRTSVKGNRLAKQHFLDITMINTSNEVLYKGIIPAISEDNYETHDYVYPLNNGKGLVIYSEEANILTLFIIQDSKLKEVGKIKKKESIIVGFKMTDDGSDIICLDYNEESEQYTLANYFQKNDKFSLKWEKKLNGRSFEFSQFLDNHYHYFDDSYRVDMVKQLHDSQFGIEVYDLSGNLLLDKSTTERLYFVSYYENNKISYIGALDKYIEYQNSNGEMQTLNLSNILKLDTALNIRPFKIINFKDYVFFEFKLIPHYTHKNYYSGLLSGIGVMPKSDLSKGKFYTIFDKSNCTTKIINDTIYLMKAWSGQFPDTVKKTGLPISN